MEITKGWLIDKEVCSEDMDIYLAQKETDGVKLLKKLIYSDEIILADQLAIWIMDRKQYVDCAVYMAEKNVHFFEKRITENKILRLKEVYNIDFTPRQVIEVVKKCTKNSVLFNRTVLRKAVNDAIFFTYVGRYPINCVYSDDYWNARHAIEYVAYVAQAAYDATETVFNSVKYDLFYDLRKKLLKHALKTITK